MTDIVHIWPSTILAGQIVWGLWLSVCWYQIMGITGTSSVLEPKVVPVHGNIESNRVVPMHGERKRQIRIPSFRAHNAPLSWIVSALSSTGCAIGFEDDLEDPPSPFVDADGRLVFYANRVYSLELDDVTPIEILTKTLSDDDKFILFTDDGYAPLNVVPKKSTLTKTASVRNFHGNTYDLIRRVSNAFGLPKTRSSKLIGGVQLEIDSWEGDARGLLNEIIAKNQSLTWSVSIHGVSISQVAAPYAVNVDLDFGDVSIGSPTLASGYYIIEFGKSVAGVSTTVVELVDE